MNSTKSRTREPSRVRIYNEEHFDTLLLDDDKSTQGGVSPGKPETSRSGGGGTSRVEEERSAIKARSLRAAERARQADLDEQRKRRFERHRDDAKRMQADSERQVRERLVMNSLRREEKFNHYYSDLVEGRRLASEIKTSLDLQDAAEKNKVRRQFEDWNQNVYGKLQNRISERLDQTTSHDINVKRRQEFQKFLDTTNTKGAIFRDIIIESEYDPLEPNRNCIKVDSSDVRDPCSRVVDKNLEESGMLDSPSAMAEAKLARTRDSLEVTMWGTGKIESTPHGFFAKIMANESKPQGDKQKSKTWDSRIPFDHYNVAVGKAITDTEFPRGKRTAPQI